MGLSKQQINGLIEAQYHYFESREPEKAAQVVGRLMEPMYNVGRYAELLLILEKTINSVGQLEPDFFIFHARSLSELGRHEQALAEIAVVELEVGDDPEKRAAILIDRANFMRRAVQTSRRGDETSRADEIIGYYRQAYDLYDRLVLPRTEGQEEERQNALSNMASCLLDEGAMLQYFRKESFGALERYRQALAIFKEVEDADGIGVVYKQMGEIYGSRQFPEMYDPERAARLFEQALTIFRENYLPRRMLETLYQIGRLFRKPYQYALEKFREYLEIAGELQLSREQAIAKRHIAELTYLLHKQELAAQASSGWLMGESPATALEIDRHTLARDTSGLEREKQFYLSVINLAEEATRVLRVLEFDAWSQRALANCHYLMGKIYLDLGEPARALEQFRDSLATMGNAERFASAEDSKRRELARLRILQTGAQTEDFRQIEGLMPLLENFGGLMLQSQPEDLRNIERRIAHLEAED